MQHPGEACLTRVGAVTLRENLRRARNAYHVRVAVILIEKGADLARELCVRQCRYAKSARSARRRDAYRSPLRLPAHMTSAFSLLSL